MRTDFRKILALAFVLLACCGRWPALAEDAPGDCLGIHFDIARPLVVSRISSTTPRTFYVKSAWEDASCPSRAIACLRKAYLVSGDLVLTSKTNGAYTCVAYQSPHDRKQVWSNGWIPSSSLAPVAPAHAARLADWTGTWSRAGGEITITESERGDLHIEGEATYPAAQNVHTGVINADAKPTQGILTFADDGSVAFDAAAEGSCLVRMQKIDALLLVEDNSACGGAMVTFTGLYRRRP